MSDPVDPHKDAIWHDISEICHQLKTSEFGDEYKAVAKTLQSNIRYGGETKERAFRSASLLALYAQLESRPTNDALAVWRKYFGQEPKADDRKADHLRELLSEFEGDLLYKDVDLSVIYDRILNK